MPICTRYKSREEGMIAPKAIRNQTVLNMHLNEDEQRFVYGYSMNCAHKIDGIYFDFTQLIDEEKFVFLIINADVKIKAAWASL